VALDEAANARGASAIHAAGARVGVYVVPTDEEVVIARATRAVVGLDS
jgi:acetate kinase